MVIMAQHPQQKQRDHLEGAPYPSNGHKTCPQTKQQDNNNAADASKQPTSHPQDDQTDLVHLQRDPSPKKTTINPLRASQTNDNIQQAANRVNDLSLQPFRSLEDADYHRDYQQQHLRMRDGKRALIKNQLYLIEQLQLENANLRNERDQLQLENEELKFQLQIISSSDILNQSGPSFDDRQLEKLVANDTRAICEAKCGPRTTTGENLQQAYFEFNNATNAQPITCNRNFNVISSTSLSKSDAAFAGQGPSNLRLKHSVARVPPTPTSGYQIRSGTTKNMQLDRHIASVVDGTDYVPPNLSQPPPSSIKTEINGGVYGALSSPKSCSLTALDRNSLSSSVGPTKPADLVGTVANDEEQFGVNQVAQRYGDSKQVQLAAIAIQRAFRKYQICKRFRTITEQLRHSHIAQKSPDKTNERNSNDNSKPVVPSNEPSAVVTGVTKAAAWESLSYAASRLAASAAAATNNTKQVFFNGVTKSASSQQVAVSDSYPPISQSHPIKPAMILSNNHRQPKSDSMVAAALNFQQLESIRKRQYRVGLNIFNKNPEKGISFLIAHSFIDSSPPYIKTSTSYYLSNQLHFHDKKHITHPQLITIPKQICQLCHEEDNLKRNVAHFLLHRKGLAKEKIGQYLGNLQSSFNQDVLKYYLQELDFNGLQIDMALRKFSSTLRLPGEAQKIERFVDYFAQRYVQCQQSANVSSSNTNLSQTPIHKTSTLRNDSPSKQNVAYHNRNNLTQLSKDEIFILTFAIIMLNTDLHSPSLKSTTRMSASQFVHNLRGVFNSQTISETDLREIYERVKVNQITTAPDHVTHVMKVQHGLTVTNFQRKDLPNLCVPHRRLVCFCRLFEVYDVNRKERVGQHQREIFLFNDLLLITKLSRRSRTNNVQQYIYRQIIPLQGLYVQLFQANYYNYGIRLCQRSNDETLIMFNARNELDQGRFVDDLTESIAEMDEMETIREHNIVETIHLRHLERLKRHATIHKEILKEHEMAKVDIPNLCDNQFKLDDSERLSEENTVIERQVKSSASADKPNTKFSSMTDIPDIMTEMDKNQVDTKDSNQVEQSSESDHETDRSKLVRVPKMKVSQGRRDGHSMRKQRSCSIGSIHSMDSGLFLSRDVSPNQSG